MGSWYSAKLKWNLDLSQLLLVQCLLLGSFAPLPNQEGLGSETNSDFASTFSNDMVAAEEETLVEDVALLVESAAVLVVVVVMGEDDNVRARRVRADVADLMGSLVWSLRVCVGTNSVLVLDVVELVGMWVMEA